MRYINLRFTYILNITYCCDTGRFSAQWLHVSVHWSRYYNGRRYLQ